MQTHVYIEVDTITTKEDIRTYGYVIEAKDGGGKTLKAVEGYGSVLATTRGAFIAAAAEALGRFTRSAEVHLHMADSWVLNYMGDPLDRWAADGFVRRDGKELKNREHWEKLHGAKAGLLIVPEAERYSEWSERLMAGIEKRTAREDRDVRNVRKF